MAKKQHNTLAQLQALVRMLGWRWTLRRHQLVIGDDAPADLCGRVITWYECGRATGGRTDCFLQINEHPQGQSRTYLAAVYAIRYRICTGWAPLELASNESRLRREADRLRPRLAFHWFADAKSRREFRRLHPECAGFSWRRNLEEGTPRIREAEIPGSR